MKVFYKIALIWVFIATPTLSLIGCDGPTMTENAQMEEAEKAYENGEYTKALNIYEDFLNHYQTSPLTPIAKQRILIINREVSAIMRRKGSPAPEYMKRKQ